MKHHEYFISRYPTQTISKKDFITEMLQFNVKSLIIKFLFNFKGGARDFWERVFRSFDNNNDGIIDFKEYLLSLSTIGKGSLEDKLNCKNIEYFLIIF